MTKQKFSCSLCKYSKFSVLDNAIICIKLDSPFCGEPIKLCDPCKYFAIKRETSVVKRYLREADDEEE